MPDWIFYVLIAALVLAIAVIGIMIWLLNDMAKAGAGIIDGIIKGFMR